MKNVTVTLDEETARWARVEAARHDVSLSAFLREILDQAKSTYESYPDAMQRYRSRAARPLKNDGSYPSREETHDRDGLR